MQKVCRIPGGGWRTHGRHSNRDCAADRAKIAGVRAGYVYLPSAVDGFSRLVYTSRYQIHHGRFLGRRPRLVCCLRIRPSTPKHNGRAECYQRRPTEEV